MTKSWRNVISIHPAAELFPLMSPEELRALGEDIKAHGLRAPIVITRYSRAIARSGPSLDSNSAWYCSTNSRFGLVFPRPVFRRGRTTVPAINRRARSGLTAITSARIVALCRGIVRRPEDRDYRGELNVAGREFWVSAWIKQGKCGKFMSLAVKPKDARKGQASATKPSACDELNDEIPF